MANKIATVTLMHGCRGLKQALVMDGNKIEFSAAVEIIMVASFNPHSPAAKMVGFLKFTNADHTCDKIQVVPNEGESQ